MLIRPYAASDFAAVTALWDATGISIQYNDPAKDIRACWRLTIASSISAPRTIA